jgi:hypothetical protein
MADIGAALFLVDSLWLIGMMGQKTDSFQIAQDVAHRVLQGEVLPHPT